MLCSGKEKTSFIGAQLFFKLHVFHRYSFKLHFQRLLSGLEIIYRPGKYTSITLDINNTAHKTTRYYLVTEADHLHDPQSTFWSLLSNDLRTHCKRKRTDKCNSTGGRSLLSLLLISVKQPISITRYVYKQDPWHTFSYQQIPPTKRTSP